MSSSLRKVSLLIIAIIVMPVLIFSVFEIGNYRQNEKVIQDIYKNQLDAILFSINQYSDDIISNLASRIENSTNNFKPDTGNDLSKICLLYTSDAADEEDSVDLGGRRIIKK